MRHVTRRIHQGRRNLSLNTGSEDCIGRIDNEPVDCDAVDENDEPPFYQKWLRLEATATRDSTELAYTSDFPKWLQR